MPIQFFAGQRLTADQLQATVPDRVVQGADQDVVSSTALVDSNIVIPIDGLLKIDFKARYTSRGGGLRWAWEEFGSINSFDRSIESIGEAATSTGSSYANITEMRFRSIVTLTEQDTVPHGTNSTAGRLDEILVVEGSGTITFQFAQETSNAGATTFDAFSYATITHLGS